MGQLKRAINFRNEFINKHSEHESEVRNLFQFMKDRLDESGSVRSVMREVNLFIRACEDLLKSCNNPHCGNDSYTKTIHGKEVCKRCGTDWTNTIFD